MIRSNNISVRPILLFAISLAMWAQSFSGRIVGIVTDSTGAVVPKTSITIKNDGTGAQRHMTTDTSGLYVASELPIGYYTVRFEYAGLSKVERLGV